MSCFDLMGLGKGLHNAMGSTGSNPIAAKVEGVYMAKFPLYSATPPAWTTFVRDFKFVDKPPHLQDHEWKNVDALAYADFLEFTVDFEVVKTNMNDLAKLLPGPTTRFNHALCNWHVYQHLALNRTNGLFPSFFFPVPTSLLETRKVFAYKVEDMLFSFETLHLTRAKNAERGVILEVE